MCLADTAPPPPVERRPAAATYHGQRLVDDYAWLKADNWREVMRDPAVLPAEIRQVIEAENTHAAAVMAPTAALREALAGEMRGRIKEDDASVPQPDGPFAYFTRFREGGQHELVCRKPRNGGDESILLDGDALAEGKSFLDLGDYVHSPDHRLLAWSADDNGSEYYTLKVRDLTTGVDIDDVLTETEGSAVWCADSAAFYYIRLDDEHRPSRVYRHVLGTQQDDDELVYEEKDSGFFVDVAPLQCGDWATIDIHDHETSEVWLLDLKDRAAKPRRLAPRRTGNEYEVELHPHWPAGEPTLIIKTNLRDAEDYMVVTAPLARPDRRSWRPLIRHVAGRTIRSVDMLKNWMVRLERDNGLPRIVVRSLADGEEHVIAFDEEAYGLGVDIGLEFDTDVIRFIYSSMTTPTEVWEYNLAARTRRLIKRQEIPSGHNPANYVTRRIFAAAADGAQVPISLVHRAGLKLDGSAPCLLYGYGAYGSAIPAAFSGNRLSLVDRGFVFAIAHVRGGADKGRRWYRDGKLKKKPNSFTDFLACADHLVAEGFTARGRIVAQGGSAGGMLMGAVANMAAGRFAGIIAEVPFVDVLQTMLDETLPMTPPEWPEWGDPIRSKEAFATIASYSPVDNVSAQTYPPLCILAGLTDPRVTYWEPLKWVAKLRATKTDSNPIVMRTNMDSGHAGAAGRFDQLEEVAYVYGFALAVTGAAGV